MVRKYLGLTIALLSLFTLSNAQFTIKETDYDFGLVNDTTTALYHTFELVNESERPNYVKRVVASCLCISSEYTNDTIVSGDTALVRIKLKATMLRGEFEKPLVIKDGLGNNYYITLRGKKSYSE